MKKEEYIKIRVGDILFHKKTGKVVKMKRGWSPKDKTEFKETDCLWGDKSVGGEDNYGFAVKANECDDWIKVIKLSDFDGYPHAHANFAIMKIQELYGKLQNQTII